MANKVCMCHRHKLNGVGRILAVTRVDLDGILTEAGSIIWIQLPKYSPE